MNPAPRALANAQSGSFRDRNGRVYVLGQRVLRGLGHEALQNFRNLLNTRFYQDFSKSGEIISSRELDLKEVPDEIPSWAGYLEHELVPCITYPYEWTFSMLRDAALLQLRLLEAALLEGWTMKDATPYNVQFIGKRAVFIDLPSFEPLAKGSPWNGYRQFCEMNLFPLMLQAYKGVDFQRFMRARIDGIDVQTAARLFVWGERIKPGVFSHVWLQGLLDRKYGSTNRNLRAEIGSAGFGKAMLLANVRKLLRLVRGLRWKTAGSEWVAYEESHTYSEQDLAAKYAFVERAIQASRPEVTWDLGCNTGRYSRLAASHGSQVVAMDADHLSVERLYLDPTTMEGGQILPVVQDFSDPSPSWGWNQRERGTLESRSAPQLLLCLALLHHMVIGRNIPLDQFVDWLASLKSALVIEFVSREDAMVSKLLLNRSDHYPDYCQNGLESALARHFVIENQVALGAGQRRLYYCNPRPVP